MDPGPLRVLVCGLNFQAHGVPATVMPPGEDPIVTRVIWPTTGLDAVPSRLDLRRSVPRRIAALPRADVPQVPRGTLILAADYGSAVIQRWQVDGVEAIEPEHVRVIVIPAAETT
jgi:hypothetical protein